jgi:hypothetical protein
VVVVVLEVEVVEVEVVEVEVEVEVLVDVEVEVVEKLSVPDGVATTTYRETSAPPSLLGAAQVTTTRPSAATVEMIVGTPGAPTGVTASESADGEPWPMALVARTVNRYGTPFVRPPTEQEVSAVEQFQPPVSVVTV